MPRAMVFDIGRVLISWDPEGFYDRVIGAGAREVLFREVDLHGANSSVDGGAPWRETFAGLAERHPPHAEAIMLWHDRWVEMTRPAIEETAEVVRELRAAGVPLYALTNFGVEPLRVAQAEYEVLTMFDGMIVSGEVGIMKPDPGIYARVEEVAGLSGDDLLYTDDSLPNVEAAAGRGWATHHFRDAAGLRAWLVGQGVLRLSDFSASDE